MRHYAVFQMRWLRRLGLCLGLLTLLISFQSEQSRAQQDTSALETESRLLAAQAETLMRDPSADRLPMILLGIRALKTAYTEAADGALLHALQGPYTTGQVEPGSPRGGLSPMTFSPDGRQFITRDDQNRLYMLDTVSGSVLGSFGGYYKSLILIVRYSPDGQNLLIGSVDGSIRLQELISGRVLHRWQVSDAGLVDAQFSPDGSRIMLVSVNESVYMWDANSGSEVFRLPATPNSAVHRRAQFSPDGRMLLTYYLAGQGPIQTWDAQTGKLLRSIIGEHLDPVSGASLDAILSAAFAPDGQNLLLVRRHQEIDAFSYSLDLLGPISETSIRRIEFLHSKEYLEFSFSPGSHRLMAFNVFDASTIVFDTTDGGLLHFYSGEDKFYPQLQLFTPDGRSVLTYNSLVDLDSDRLLQQYLLESSGTLALSPDGRLALRTGYSAFTWVTEVGTGRIVSQIVGLRTRVKMGTFSPDGRLALLVSEDNVISEWDTRTGKLQFILPAESYVFNLAFTPEGDIFFADYDGLYIFDHVSGQRLRSVPLPPFAQIVFPSPDYQVALVGSVGLGSPIRLISLKDGKVLHIFEQETILEGAVFSRDRRFLLFNTFDKSEYWDLVLGIRIEGAVVGLLGGVSADSFLPDGQTLLLNYGNQVRVYHVDSNGLGSGSPQLTRMFEIDPTATPVSSTRQRYVYSLPEPDTAAIESQSKLVTELWRFENSGYFPPVSARLPGDIVDVSADLKRVLVIPGRDLLTAPRKSNVVILADFETRQALMQYPLDADRGTAIFSPDGQTLLIIGDSAHVLEAATGKILCTFNAPSDGSIDGVFAPDARHVLMTSRDATGKNWGNLYELETCQSTHRYEDIRKPLFLPDGKRFLTFQNTPHVESQGPKGEIRVYDVETEQLIGEWQASIENFSVQRSPDSQALLLVNAVLGIAEVHEPVTGELLQTFRPPVGSRYDGHIRAFSADGRFILLSSSSGLASPLLHVYNAATGKLIRSISYIETFQFLAATDDQFAIGWDNGLRLRRLPITIDTQLEQACATVWRDFTHEERQQFGLDDETPTCPKFVASLTLLPTIDASRWTPIPTRVIPTLPPTSANFGTMSYMRYQELLTQTATAITTTPTPHLMVTLAPVTPYKTVVPIPITRQVQPITPTAAPSAFATVTGTLVWTPITSTQVLRIVLPTLQPTITAPSVTPLSTLTPSASPTSNPMGV